MVFFLFAAAIGFTYLSTVPPTIGLVAKLHGARYMATLFGIVMLSHHIGGFRGDRQLRLDVVGGHRALPRRRGGASADSRSTPGAGGGGCINGDSHHFSAR